MKSLLVLLLFISFSLNLEAQNLVQKFDGIPVTISSQLSQVPFDGGRDNPKVQFLDIDNDGLIDLFMYDKDTTLYFYKNTGTAFNPEFTLITKKFQNLNIKNWYHFVDLYNNGIYHLFSGSPDQKIYFYRNNGSPSNPQFNLEISELRSTGDTVIYQDANSIPTFFDIDNDGLKDMFLGSVSGTVTLYRNVSTTGEIRFQFQTDFWQNILIIGKADHGANSFVFTDLNSDGVSDIYWGDLFNPSFYKLTNFGTSGNPQMSMTDSINPPGDPYFSYGYNAPRFSDLDNDGDLDLFITVLYISQTSDNFIFYENIGTPQSPQFVRRTENYMNPLDVGSNSNPVFADLDGNGLQDLIIGSSNNKISLYTNSGTATQPAFNLTHDSLPLGISQYNFNLSPAFGDLDGNGTLDLFVGSFLRDSMWYFTNTGSVQNPQFTLQGTVATLGVTNLGQSSTPALVDIDSDADLDLFSGNWNGRIHFYRNDGTPQNPQFTYITNFLDSIDVGDESVPRFYDIDTNGTLDLFIGNRLGRIWYFKNTGTPQQPDFTFVSDSYKDLYAFSNAAPQWCDIDNDTDPDMFIGNVKGGIIYYENQDIIGIENISNELPDGFRLYPNFPNPFNPVTNIRFDLVKSGIVTLRIFDIAGRLISIPFKGYLSSGSYSYSFDATGLTSGVYFYSIEAGDRTKTNRMVLLK